MKGYHPDSETEEIITISEASHILGVNEATLRQWTDEGKIKAFITPGGHRRYSTSELRKFTRSRSKKLGVKDLAVEIEDTSHIHREIARRFLASNPSCRQPDHEHQQQLAGLGRNLLGLLVKYICEPSTRDSTIVSAQVIGTGFGKTLADLGLPLTDSVKAFLAHRDPFMVAVTHLIAKKQLMQGNLREAIPLANRFIDEALVYMVNAHQQYCGKGLERVNK
ncbi:MAG: helix-turn-helix domain-containing protein [Dehalococcoidia bacterium]|nr:helix-turn-helix domain-containing protein [Dehalococcoidia bacterium]